MPAISFQKYLPYFNDRYDFEFCPLDKKDQLLEFIDCHWKKDHAFVVCPALLDWQHYDAKTQKYNFSIAVERATNQIHAINGFIPSRQFGANVAHPMRWGALWKNCNDSEPGLGVMVEAHMAEYAPASFACGIGLSQTCATLGRKQHNVVGKVSRYYMLNPKISQFQLVKNQSKNDFLSSGSTTNLSAFFRNIDLAEYQNLPAQCFTDIPMFKSKEYYVNRYFLHPIYQYKATAIVKNGQIDALFFWRVCGYRDAHCVRIVDYIGKSEALIGCEDCFAQLLEAQKAEFIDFMNAGFPQEHFKAGGFLDRKDSEIILAHYFEPFLLENDDVDYKWQCEKDLQLEPIIFKGDSDLDRPNQIERS